MTPDNYLGAPCHTTQGDTGYRRSNPSKPMRTWGGWFRDLNATNLSEAIHELLDDSLRDIS